MSDNRCLAYVSVRSYVKNTLHVILYSLMFAIPQWMLLSICTTVEHISYTLICFLGALLLLTAMQMSDRLRYKWPWNWLAIGSCYELMTIGLGTFLMRTDLRLTMMTISIALLIWGFVLLLCFFIINGYNYSNPYKLAGVSLICLMYVIGFMILSTMHHWPHWTDLALLLFIPSVLIVMVSQVLISFSNLDVLSSKDALLAGFALYMNYVLVLLTCLICMQRINRNYASLNA